jgi:hypothetical protein
MEEPTADPPAVPPNPRTTRAARLVSGLFAPRARKAAGGLGAACSSDVAAGVGAGGAGKIVAGLGAGVLGASGARLGAGGSKEAVVSQETTDERRYMAVDVVSTFSLAFPQLLHCCEHKFFFASRFDSSVNLEIKLLGNRKTCRKDCKCFCIDMVVDSDRTNFSDFVESVVNKYPPGYMEVPHVQYYDEVLQKFPEIKSDQDMMCMFSKHSKSKVIFIFIVYRDPSDPYEPVTEWDFSDDDSQPTNNIEIHEDDYLKNPAPENEHVGINEETVYLEDAPHNALQIVNYPIGYENKDDEPDEEEEEDEEQGDEEDDGDLEVVEDEVPITEGNNTDDEYDKDWIPPMEVGSTYSSMPVFRLALSQYAIKRQFEFNIAKSGPQRYRAYCSRRDKDKCSWLLYASTSKGSTTVTVIC